MELQPVFRVMWRRRFSLVAGLALAVAIFIVVAAKAATAPTTVAWTSVALDTPQSQLVDVAPTGAQTLTWRASLMTYLMATTSATDELARRLRIGPDRVNVVNTAFAVPLVPTAMAQAAATAAGESVTPYVLTIFANNDVLPVISLEAAAPDRPQAVRLADAAVAVLRSWASPGGRFMSQIPTNVGNPELQPFTVTQVTPMRVKPISSSKLSKKAVGAALLVFLGWCAGVALASRLYRRLRHVGRVLPA